MKKFILMGLMALFSLAVHAQAKPMLSTTTGLALDTVTNTGTRMQQLALNGFQDVVTIVTTVTKLTGTTAGSVVGWGSVDNIDWVRLDTNVFTPTDQTTAQSFAWVINPSQYAYYRVSYTGIGTMAATLKTKIFARKK